MIVSTPDLDFASLLSEVFHELSNATQNLRARACPERNFHVVRGFCDQPARACLKRSMCGPRLLRFSLGGILVI